MSKNVLNNLWNDKANIPLLDGVFDDSLSDHEWRELEELQRSSEGCLDSEGGNMSKNCEVIIVEFEEFTDMDFREVSSFYVKNSVGQRVYFMTRSREIAEAKNAEMFGKGFYRLSSGKVSKPSGTESAVGRINSKSRSGMRKT